MKDLRVTFASLVETAGTAGNGLTRRVAATSVSGRVAVGSAGSVVAATQSGVTGAVLVASET